MSRSIVATNRWNACSAARVATFRMDTASLSPLKTSPHMVAKSASNRLCHHWFRRICGRRRSGLVEFPGVTHHFTRHRGLLVRSFCWSKKVLGMRWAGITAIMFGFFGALMGTQETWYTSPIARSIGGGNLGHEMTFAFSERNIPAESLAGAEIAALL